MKILVVQSSPDDFQLPDGIDQAQHQYVVVYRQNDETDAFISFAAKDFDWVLVPGEIFQKQNHAAHGGSINASPTDPRNENDRARGSVRIKRWKHKNGDSYELQPRKLGNGVTEWVFEYHAPCKKGNVEADN
ncbi:MAG: hypothetical protein SVU69_02555 [Pseudomonadota bacterium]|nr:hypothetical protein [Pseudomonadota bacterium]